MKQSTIKKAITIEGIALHSGEKVTLTLSPAAENSGVTFIREDLTPPVRIKADAYKVSDTQLCSCLIEHNARVSTIEHLMSALASLSIDNIDISLNASEIPIMDGSAAPFVHLILEAGIQEQQADKKFIKIKSPIRVEKDDKFVILEPYDGFKIDFTIDFKHPLFTEEVCRAHFETASGDYLNQIAHARTFGFLAEVEYMRSMNLARGGSLDNAIVVDETGVMNPEGLRYPDEFVRHKILDAIGDLYVLGYSILGAYTGYKAGHALNNQLCRALLENPDAWEMVS